MPKKIINIKQLPLHIQRAIRAEASGLNLKSKRKVVAATELSEKKNVSAKQHLMEALKDNIVTKDYVIELLLKEIPEKDLMDILVKHNIASDEIVEKKERLANRFKKYGF